MKLIYQRVRDLREDHDYTQEYVSKKINIAQTTYSDYEHGLIRIPVELLIKLAELYDVSMDYICCISNKKTSFPKE